jgi:hypothetical protein
MRQTLGKIKGFGEEKRKSQAGRVSEGIKAVIQHWKIQLGT